MQMVKIDDSVSSKAKEARNKRIRARNRWNLFATMAMNPSIIRYRIRFLDVDSSLLSKKLPNSPYMNVDEKPPRYEDNHLSPTKNNLKSKDNKTPNGNPEDDNLSSAKLRQRQAKSVMGQLNQGYAENPVFF